MELAMDWVEKVAWPALRVTEPQSIAIVCVHPDEMRYARYLGVKDLQGLKAIYLLDSERKRFQFKRPDFIAGRPGLLRKLVLATTNPFVGVMYAEIHCEGSVPLQDIKDALITNVNLYPEYWMEMDVLTLQGFISDIKRASNVSDLFALLGY